MNECGLDVMKELRYRTPILLCKLICRVHLLKSLKHDIIQTHYLQMPVELAKRSKFQLNNMFSAYKDTKLSMMIFTNAAYNCQMNIIIIITRLQLPVLGRTVNAYSALDLNPTMPNIELSELFSFTTKNLNFVFLD